MIIIKAKKKGKGVKVKITLAGPGGDVADEAAAIVLQLPQRLIDIDADIFHRFSEGVKCTLDDMMDQEADDDDQ